FCPTQLGRPQGFWTNAPPPDTRGIFLEAGGIVLNSLSLYYANVNNGQNTTIFYATNIAGPWQSHQLNYSAFDPGLYIETNGTGYIATAGGWQSNTTFLTINSTFSQVIGTHIITNGLGLEGSHVIKRGG